MYKDMIQLANTALKATKVKFNDDDIESDNYLSLNNYFGRRSIQTMSYSGPNVGLNFLH